MSLSEVDGPLGPPWAQRLHGSLDRLVVESELLTDNPLGDPARRPLWVYRPPGVERGSAGELPSVYILQGYFNQLHGWQERKPLEPTAIERYDALFAPGERTSPAVLVFVDAWTAYGGSQFLDSPSIGRYQSYLCDEVVGFVDERYPTAAERERRGLAGHSSGGYGAIVTAMLRPELFAGFASHAADSLFEVSMLPIFGQVARALRDHWDGSYERLLGSAREVERFEWSKLGEPLMTYGCAAAYSPDPKRPGHALLPFELDTGRLVDEVWQRWLRCDPVRMVAPHAEALRSMRHVHVEAGRRDEFFADLGAQAISDELRAIGVEHRLELFDGAHSGIAHRYPVAIRELVASLSR